MIKGVHFFLVLCIIVLFSCTVHEDLPGTWVQEASWEIDGDTFEARVEFIFEQTDLDILFYGQDGGWVLLPTGSVRGTYTVEGNIITFTISEILLDDVWTEMSDGGTAQYDISKNTMDLIIDYDEDDVYDDSYPFDETFPGGDGPSTDILYELTKEE